LMAVGPLVQRNHRKVTPQVSPQLGLAELSP